MKPANNLAVGMDNSRKIRRNKTLPTKRERNERFANASEPIVPIPTIAVAVDVHVPIAIVAVEDGVGICEKCLPCHHPLNILRVVFYFVS